MQSFRVVGAMAAAALVSGLAVAGAAHAQAARTGEFGGEATLASPAHAPPSATIDGVAWRCEGDQCLGHAARRSGADGLVKECKRVAAVVGPIASYKSRGRELTAGQVRACNRGAVTIQTARN
ncbi:CC_3452 family protein [Phenylobacterium sp. VNQ135]|uniref:CC_3452 family protein n=1 Tax=Phenylobacterium sp. VNQ135 TaxID=3400922 RepID=UPI003C061E34